MQRGNERWVPATRIPGRISYDLPGDQQQLHLHYRRALSATVGIVDSFAISRRASVAEMLHIPSLVPSLAKNHEWPRSCGTPVREARSLACGEHRIALSPLAACKSPLLQVAVAAMGGGILELPSRNQSRVADRHRDGDGPVRVNESSVEKRTEQGRLSGGCAQ